MGKASNFVSTDATKRRKQIASVANKFVLLVFFWVGFFLACLLLKNAIFMTFQVWKKEINYLIKFLTVFLGNYFENGISKSAVLIG